MEINRKVERKRQRGDVEGERQRTQKGEIEERQTGEI